MCVCVCVEKRKDACPGVLANGTVVITPRRHMRGGVYKNFFPEYSVIIGVLFFFSKY